jgi:kynurenine formamidase
VKRDAIRITARAACLLAVAVAAVAQAQPASPPGKKPSRPAARPRQVALAVEEALARDRDPLRRETAAQVLGQRGDAGAVPLLARALAKDPNIWVRARAAEALGAIGASAALPPLQSALASEKDQRARRMIAAALVRLGHAPTLKELMWQLKSGTNHTKAEVMQLLVGVTGQPLGQDVEAWWSYLRAGGERFVAGRRGGSPAVFELRGVVPRDGAQPRGPLLYGTGVLAWRRVPAFVIALGPTLAPIARAELEAWERAHGRIPDGCLLLIHTRWREAKAPPPRPVVPAKRPPPPAPDHGRSARLRSPRADTAEPYLELDAARFLLERAPRLIGVGIDASGLDAHSALDRPARSLLTSRGRLALEAVGDLERLHPLGTRLLIVGLGGERVRLLALLP